jgi:hypothetical protein
MAETIDYMHLAPREGSGYQQYFVVIAYRKRALVKRPRASVQLHERGAP